MNLKTLFILCTSAVLIIACKRKGTVSGKVTNVFDGLPVEGIEVRISENSDLSPSSKNLQIGASDTNGDYMINVTYNTRISYDYYVSLNPNDNYNKENPYLVKDTVSDILKAYFYFTSQYRSLKQDITDVKKTKGKQHFDFNVAPCGRLRIIARNVSPANDSDKIVVSVIDKNLIEGATTVYSGKFRVPVTGSYMLIPTSGTVSLKWLVTSNNQKTTLYDTIPLAPFSKATYYIEY